MTNLQQGSQLLSARNLRRIWFGAPAAVLGVLSLMWTAAVLAPLWQTLQRDSTRLRELEDLQMQVSLMRQQLRAQDIQQEKALTQRDKLLRMIAGSGDVSTLLAVLDRVAKESGVRLDLYEPQAGAAPPPTAAPAAGGNQAQPPPPNPLETAGLQAQGMLISLRGPYPRLLDFLRRLESLNLLVIQSDLKLEAPPPSTDPKKPASQDVTMKLSLKVYGRTDAGAAQAAPPPAAGARPGSRAPANAPGTAPPAPPAQPAGRPARPAPAATATPAQPPPAGAAPTPPPATAAPAAAGRPANTPPTGR